MLDVCDLWSTHFAWTKKTADYSTLCTFVHGHTCLGLTVDKAVDGLKVIFIDQWESMRPAILCQIQDRQVLVRPITGLEKCQDRQTDVQTECATL